MRASLVTPRPLPDRLVPMLAGALVIGLALPLFALAGWSLRAWGLGAFLWVATQLLGILLRQLRTGASNLAASGVVGFAMMIRSIAVAGVLFAVAVGDAGLALTAALLYAAAYSVELVLSLLSYFGATP